MEGNPYRPRVPLCQLEDSAGNLQETPRPGRGGFTRPAHPRRISPILPLASHQRARLIPGTAISTLLAIPPVVTVRPAASQICLPIPSFLSGPWLPLAACLALGPAGRRKPAARTLTLAQRGVCH